MQTRNSYTYLSAAGLITADSLPDHDDWGWDSFWNCADWVDWHKAMKSKYGLESANMKFATEWNKMGMGAHALGCRTVDPAFRKYTSANDLYEITWKSAGGFKYLFRPIGTVLEVGGTVGTEVAKALTTTSKGLKFLVPVIILIGVGLAAKYGWRVATQRKV